MASQELLLALDKLKITDATDRTSVSTLYSTVGIKPADLVTHTERKTFFITGLAPSDFYARHGGPEFNFAELIEKFQTIYTDYGKNLSFDVASRAVEFCSKMIYEVGPLTRKVTKAGGDEVYKFVFVYSPTKLTVAFVSTFKSGDPKSDYTSGQKIILTVKQAMLLAIKVLEQLNRLGEAQEPPTRLLTPLAGAVFSKEDIPKIARDLKVDSPTILNVINSSSQSGGHYTMSSNMACAAVCAIMSTKGLKDKDIKVSIISKTLRQYLAKQKQWEVGTFEVYAKYAHGGIPDGMEPENLMSMLDTIQLTALTARKAKQAAETTGIEVTVDTPTILSASTSSTGQGND